MSYLYHEWVEEDLAPWLISILVFINLLHFVLEVGQLCSILEMAYNRGHVLYINGISEDLVEWM